MKRSSHSISAAVADRLALRIHNLLRDEKFDARSAAVVSAAALRHPRDPVVLLAAAEYRDVADAHKRTWRGDRHERAYLRVLKLDPKNARAWENLAAVLDIAERYPDAARAAQRAIRLGNGAPSPGAIALLARIRAQQGGRHKAESRRLARTLQRARSAFARSTARDILRGEWDPG